MRIDRSRRSTKFFLSLVAVVASLAFAGSASAETNGTLTYSVADGEVTITGCDGGAAACPTSLGVPATIDDKPVTSIADSAFLDAVNLETVTIADSVTSIGKLAFGRDYGLTAVTLPSGLTTVSANLFRGATALASVNIPEGVTTIESGAFFNTELLRSVTLPSTLKNLGRAAFQGSGLTSVSIPDGVESIGICAFMWNTSLVTVGIPSSVVSVGNEAFRGASSLKEVHFAGDAPSFGSNVFEFDPVDAQATVAHAALTGFGADGDDFHGLVVHYALEATYSVGSESVTITGCIGGPSACPSKLVIPATIEGKPVTAIDRSAFYGSPSLTDVTLPDSVTSIGEAAFYFVPLKKISLGEGLQEIGHAAFAYTSLTSVTFPASLTSIASQAFAPAPLLSDLIFQGNAPTVGSGALVNVAPGAIATLASPLLTGFGLNGELFDGLVIRGGVFKAPTLSGAPTEPTKSTSATFTITGDDGTTFRCSVDGAHYLACASPFRVRRLAPGDHTLSVKQAGAAGSDSAPVVVNWTVTQLDAPRLLSKVGLKFNFKTKVTTLSLNAAADEGSPNSIKWVEYSNHPKRPAANALQAPSRIRAYAPTVSLAPGQVAFWVRFKDTNLKWSGWYRTRFKPSAIGW